MVGPEHDKKRPSLINVRRRKNKNLYEGAIIFLIQASIDSYYMKGLSSNA